MRGIIVIEKLNNRDFNIRTETSEHCGTLSEREIYDRQFFFFISPTDQFGNKFFILRQ